MIWYQHCAISGAYSTQQCGIKARSGCGAVLGVCQVSAAQLQLGLMVSTCICVFHPRNTLSSGCSPQAPVNTCWVAVLLLRLFYGTLLHACPLLRWFLLSYLKTLGGEGGAGVSPQCQGSQVSEWSTSGHAAAMGAVCSCNMLVPHPAWVPA
jgi:hypothetical protein